MSEFKQVIKAVESSNLDFTPANQDFHKKAPSK